MCLWLCPFLTSSAVKNLETFEESEYCCRKGFQQESANDLGLVYCMVSPQSIVKIYVKVRGVVLKAEEEKYFKSCLISHACWNVKNCLWDSVFRCVGLFSSLF